MREQLHMACCSGWEYNKGRTRSLVYLILLLPIWASKKVIWEKKTMQHTAFWKQNVRVGSAGASNTHERHGRSAECTLRVKSRTGLLISRCWHVGRSCQWIDKLTSLTYRFWKLRAFHSPPPGLKEVAYQSPPMDGLCSNWVFSYLYRHSLATVRSILHDQVTPHPHPLSTPSSRKLHEICLRLPTPIGVGKNERKLPLHSFKMGRSSFKVK